MRCVSMTDEEFELVLQALEELRAHQAEVADIALGLGLGAAEAAEAAAAFGIGEVDLLIHKFSEADEVVFRRAED